MDDYPYFLPEQWIDLGEDPLPDGDYALRVVADPLNRLRESSDGADPARESPAANEGVTLFHVESGCPDEAVLALLSRLACRGETLETTRIPSGRIRRSTVTASRPVSDEAVVILVGDGPRQRPLHGGPTRRAAHVRCLLRDTCRRGTAMLFVPVDCPNQSQEGFLTRRLLLVSALGAALALPISAAAPASAGTPYECPEGYTPIPIQEIQFFIAEYGAPPGSARHAAAADVNHDSVVCYKVRGARGVTFTDNIFLAG